MPGTIYSSAKALNDNSRDAARYDVELLYLGHFLLKHRGHELRVVTHHYVDQFEGYEYFSPLSKDELELALSIEGVERPDPEIDTENIDDRVYDKLAIGFKHKTD